MVVRIAPCGPALCGLAAGLAPDARGRADERRTPPACGTTFLTDISWSSKERRWEAKLRPPDIGKTLSATIETDGTSFVRVQARLLLMSKTLRFVPYTGTLRDGCVPRENGTRPTANRTPDDPLPTADERVALVLERTLTTRRALLQTVAPSVLAQANNQPEVWGRTWDGLSRRVGAQLAQRTASNVLVATGAAAFGHDPRYQPCGCAGGWTRLGHALAASIRLADARGRLQFDPSPVLAAYGGGYVSATLSPQEARRSVRGYQLGTQALSQSMLSQVALEFGPDLRRVLARARRGR